MEGKGPYRIYDPGGSEVKARDEVVGGSSYRQLLEENSMLRERMKGLKSLGDLLEESQSEASKLRQRVEELVRDNEALKSASYAASLCAGAPVHTEAQSKPCLHPTAEKEEQSSCLGRTLQPEKPHAGLVAGALPQLPQENNELASQLKRLESSFSIFAEESNPNQLLAHLGRMAVEFHHLSSKVQKNEQRTSLLQTLCEQLRQENNELRKKMEEDHHIRNRDLEQLSGKSAEKTPAKACDIEVYEKKIKLLEKQRKDVLEVNKQWDIQWNAMKSQFEQKITDLRQRLAESQKTVLELEAEREQRQRDYDKKLLLAKSKIENVQGEKECLNSETTELKQKVRYLQDQLLPLSKQREYQEKEIQRLNRALEEALNLHSPSASQQPPGPGNFADAANNLKKQELLTQIAVLKEQVKIFEEDFRKERSDRERMNEEKEDLRRQVERLQGQITNLTNQLHQAQNECQRERTERCKLERLQMQHHKQGQQQERRTSDPTSGSVNGPLSPPYCGPFVQVGTQGLEGWPIHFPPRMPNAAGSDLVLWVDGNESFCFCSIADQSTAATATGFGKRERQNIDPGKH
uniref:TNFAIP3-interacting protein 1 n=1 Tax=Poecilia reticulata TaxID=8081 RepID=A0A3P9NHP4_POERE